MGDVFVSFLAACFKNTFVCLLLCLFVSIFS